MLGIVQYVAYLIAIYMSYRGVSDALRDFSELPGRTTGARVLRLLAAACAILLLPATFYVVREMEDFASRLGGHRPAAETPVDKTPVDNVTRWRRGEDIAPPRGE